MTTPSSYAAHRAAGLRAKAAARSAASVPVSTPVLDSGAYQRSPKASKGNAFCWLTWPTHIDWSNRGQDAAQLTRNEIIERKRAAGLDPLNIPGMGSAARSAPRDPIHFSIAGLLARSGKR